MIPRLILLKRGEHAVEENQQQPEKQEPAWKHALKWLASAILLLAALSVFVWGVDWVIVFVKNLFER